TITASATGGATITVDGVAYDATKKYGPGMYTVRAEAAGGNQGDVCFEEKKITITQPPLLTCSVDTKSEVKCFGEATGSITVTAGGGTPTYEYSIDGGTSWQSSNQFKNLAAGNYAVTVRDSNGCLSLCAGIVIAQRPELKATATPTDVVCFGDATGTAEAFPTGGTAPYTYEWSTGATTNKITGLVAGTYWVKITDANLCTVELQAIKVENLYTALSCTATSDLTTPQCEDIDFNLSATGLGGSGGYTYKWTGTGAQYLDDDEIANPVMSGAPGSELGIDYKFTVEVTDSKGCKSTCMVTVTVVQCVAYETGFGVSVMKRGEESYVNPEISQCFREDGFKRWGWTNFINTTGATEETTVELDIVLGAGKCDLNKGTKAGHVEVTYRPTGVNADEYYVNISYHMDPGFRMDEVHLYIDCEQYPTKNGTPTVAPGQYTYVKGDLGNISMWKTEDDEIVATGSFFVIAHAVAGAVNIPGDSYIPASPNEGGSFDGTGVIDPECKVIINSTSSKSVSFKAYPVPFVDEVNVSYSFEYDTNVKIDVYDMKGALVRQAVDESYIKGTLGTTKIDLSRTDNQMYFVRVTTKEGTLVKRVISTSNLSRE
uniref:T9SS type A sorting domain-containing protein n=1 Tax=uncultured Algibacter sp. TaxID=298659 RepID=UPI00260DCF16